MKKTIPIGYEDLKRIIDLDLYYIDKTMTLKPFIDNHSKVTLFTRPRRFGKTLNLSMFRRFFEDERKTDGSRIDNGYVFDDLAISQCGEKYMRHRGQYPVIKLSLKSGKQLNFDLAYTMLRNEIIREFERHSYVLSCDEITPQEREGFQAVLHGEKNEALYAEGLKLLSVCLAKYHGKKCIILIDEYDVPLENAWFAGFYEEMIGFIRSLFESALKTNDALEFAIITGSVCTCRERIFTGLNSLKIDSVLRTNYGNVFGITENEVKDMLRYYEIEKKFEEVKEWYGGYQFGNVEIYNPWSVVNYVDDLAIWKQSFPKPYTTNASHNVKLIRELVEKADMEVRGEIEQLIAGETLEKPIHEDITYGDIHTSSDNLWNFLYFTGYLTSCGVRYDGETTFVKMGIPNTEVRSIYKNTVLTWFDKKVRAEDRTPLIKAIEDGDCAAIEEFIITQLRGTISFFDYQESYYHGFLTGLLKGNGKYLVASNRENGLGRTDITLRENRFRGKAVILELKVAEDIRKMEEFCREALEQIEKNRYEDDLVSDGYEPILKYGVCFFKKGCMVKKA